MDEADIYDLSRPTSLAQEPTESKEQSIKATTSCAFAQLPEEIIEHILRLSDPNSFASLVLLNSKWRHVSQQSQLYHYQLLRCLPGIKISLSSMTEQEFLRRLKRLFAIEIKRNLYDAYLRPRQTTITLVSTSISSSAAFPGGEAFHFSFSPNGRYILAWSSSRIYLIDALADELEIQREFKIMRRPVSATILDNGALLAVLSTDHQVDVYELATRPPKHIRAVALDHPPRTIALSPTGAVLAAAYDGGVELYSLHADATLTDRRAVKCDAADSLSFSKDGTELLGTTLHSKNPSTVILTAPYFDPGENSPEDSVSQLWTTSIIFPNSSRDCSHAVLLPSSPNDDTSWTFTYDRVFETFRAVRIDDLRNGTTYFTGPVMRLHSTAKFLPSTLPASTKLGDMVSAAFLGEDIWIYGIPEDKTAVPEISMAGGDNDSTTVTRMSSSASSTSHTWSRETATPTRIPKWQILCDKARNTFVEGRKVGTLSGVSAVKWVSKDTASQSERLIAVAPGVVGHQIGADEDGLPPIDGGRLVVLDFEYSQINGDRRQLTIEVGEREPEVLEEEFRDIEAEVALVRRRTVAQKRDIQTSTARSSMTSAAAALAASRSGSVPPVPPLPSLSPRQTAPRRLSRTDEQSESGSLTEAPMDDMPYAHGAPRSGDTLRRAATAAAVNRRLYPPRAVAQDHIVYRRADGREEHPHESDADNWVPPPPPYTREPIAPLPEHLRNAVMAGSVPLVSTSLRRSSTQRTTGSEDSDVFSSLARSRTIHSPRGQMSPRPSLSHGRTRSASSITSRSETPFDSPRLRHGSVQGQSAEAEDVHSVSPPDTPPLEVTMPARPTQPHQIARRPVGAVNVGATTAVSPQSENIPSPSASEVESPEALMNATLQKPISPIPEMPQPIFPSVQSSPLPNVPAIPPRFDLISAEERSLVPAPLSMPERPTSSIRPTSIVLLPRDRIDAPVPPRPNEDHRMSGPPVQEHVPEHATEASPESLNAVPADQSISRPVALPLATASLMPQAHTTVSSNSADEMVSLTPTISNTATTDFATVATNISGPSAAQLARLSSRSGRPNVRILSDASRHRSGSDFSQRSSQGGQAVPTNVNPRLYQRHIVDTANQHPVPIHGMHPSPGNRVSMPRAPIQTIHVPNRIAMADNENYSPDSPIGAVVGMHPASSHFRTPSGHSLGASRYNASTPNLRPRPNRLDTIHSVTSNGDGMGGLHYGGIAGGPLVGRTLSRRSLSDAGVVKKRNWMGTRKGKRVKPLPVVSQDHGYAGDWRRIEDAHASRNVGEAKEKKEKKCVVM